MLVIALLVTAFSALVTAQSGANPLVPIEGTVNAGQPVTIKWKPTTTGTISLQLRWGASANLNPGTTIISGATNSGSYTWTPPTALKAGSDYTVEIIDDTNKDATNYSPVFGISSSGTGLSSASNAPSSTGSESTTKTSGTTSTTPGTTKTATNTTSTTSTTISGTTTTSGSTLTSTTSTTGSTSTTSTQTTKISSPIASPTKAPSANAGHKAQSGFAVVIGAGIAAAVF